MKTVKLLGIQGDHQYEHWRKSIEEILRNLQFHKPIEEINDVDTIINFNISAIPALLINDTLVLEQNNHTSGIAEIKSAILTYLGTRNK